MLCRFELEDPRRCVKEGKDVTNCALNFFKQIKKSCHEEFSQYANCLDRSSSDLHFKHCRTTQGVYDKCVLDNMNLERPHWGYFSRAKIHDSPRPPPPPKEKKVYGDVPDSLPEDYPKPEARYGSRFHWLS